MRMTFSLCLPVPPVRGHGPEVLDGRGGVAQNLPNRGEERERGGGEREGGRESRQGQNWTHVERGGREGGEIDRQTEAEKERTHACVCE